MPCIAGGEPAVLGHFNLCSPERTNMRRKQHNPISQLKLNKALDAMRAGATLVQVHERRSRWYLVPGIELDAATAEEVILDENVRACGDGLFPSHSQTWRFCKATGK